MTKAVFVEGMTLLLDVFLKPPQPRTMEGYWRVLEPLDADTFKAVCDRALRELDFMPSPGKLLEFAGYSRTTGLPEQAPAYHFPIPE